jgi:outer membrane receptor for ferrienterochelin and colicins
MTKSLLKISLCLIAFYATPSYAWQTMAYAPDSSILKLTASNSTQDTSKILTPISDKILEELTVTGSYQATGISKSVNAVRIISIEKLKILGVQTVGEALKFQANIRLQQDNVLGTGLTMQGVSGENVKILLDGMPITGRQNGNIDLSQLNINAIERIEIVEGPLSVQYGTNALAGTINIITKKAPSKNIDFQVNTYYETVGTFNLATSFGWRNDKQSLMVSAGRNFFNGWTPETVADGETTTLLPQQTINERFQEWKPKLQYFSDVHYGLKLGDTKLSYVGNFLNEYIINKGRPLLPYRENAFDDTYKTQRYLNGFTVSKPVGATGQANLMVSYSQYNRMKNTYYRDLVRLTEVLTENEGDQDTSRFDLITARGTFAKTKGKKLNFETGFDFNIENGTGLRLRENGQTIGDYAAFLSTEWKITEGLTVRPGLRASYNTSYATPLIPSLNVRWALNDAWTWRVSYGSGFRSPSLKELYFYFVDINHNIRGNEKLVAEKSNNFNSVLTFKKSTDKTVYKFEASSFFNDIENLITLAILKGGQNEYGYVNIGRLKTLGGQFYGETVFNNLTLGAGMAYMQRQNVFNNENFKAGTYEGRANVQYNIPKYGWSFNAWYKYSGQQLGYVLNEDRKVTPTFIGAYSMADAGLSKKFNKSKILVTTGIKNVFNVKNIQSQLVSSGHSSSSGNSPLAMGRFFFTKCEISL